MAESDWLASPTERKRRPYTAERAEACGVDADRYFDGSGWYASGPVSKAVRRAELALEDPEQNAHGKEAEARRMAAA